MTDRKQALTDLLEKVKADEFTPKPGGPTMNAYQEFSASAEKALPQDVRAIDLLAYRAYNGSLDAAKALHEAMLPKTAYDLSHWPNGRYHVCLTGTHGRAGGGRWHGRNDVRSDGTADCPARAWLIAVLRALVEMEGDQ